jgi:hypothetical protein
MVAVIFALILGLFTIAAEGRAAACILIAKEEVEQGKSPGQLLRRNWWQ